MDKEDVRCVYIYIIYTLSILYYALYIIYTPIPQLLYPFIYQWILRLLPYLGY